MDSKEEKHSIVPVNKSELNLVQSKDGTLINPRDVIKKFVGDDSLTVLELFLKNKSVDTIRSYSRSLESFADFLDINPGDITAVIKACETPAEMITLTEDFRKYLRTIKNLRGNSINTRITALRSFVKILYDLGMITWMLNISNDPVTLDPERTQGPPLEAIKKVIAKIQKDNSEFGIRDLALFTIFLEFALRRNEIHTLDIEHIEDSADGIRLYQLGKKRKEREWTPSRLSETGSNIIRTWLTVRGLDPGPLFISYKPSKINKPMTERRLSNQGIWEIVKKRARDVDVDWKRACHGLRHAAITNFLEQTAGDLRAAREFARHKNINTTIIYDDNRRLAIKDKSKKAASTWWNSTYPEK